MYNICKTKMGNVSAATMASLSDDLERKRCNRTPNDSFTFCQMCNQMAWLQGSVNLLLESNSFSTARYDPFTVQYGHVYNIHLEYVRDSFILTTSVESGFLFDTLSRGPRGEGLALTVAGGKEVGTGCYSGGFGVGTRFERGVPQIEQDGGRFSLGVTDSSIDQQCRTDFCAPKYVRDSFNLTFGGKRISVRYVVGRAEAGRAEFCLTTVG
ncbi:unnamed protein product [Pylaiella littoralis]